MFSFNDSLKTGDSVLQRHEFALKTGENFGDSKRLRHETLEFSSAFDREFIGFRQFVHAENSNDILERLVILKHFLDSGGNSIVFTTS